MEYIVFVEYLHKRHCPYHCFCTNSKLIYSFIPHPPLPLFYLLFVTITPCGVENPFIEKRYVIYFNGWNTSVLKRTIFIMSIFQAKRIKKELDA